MKTEQKLELRAKPKLSIQVNKPLVLIVGAIVLFVVLWAVIVAFSDSQKPKAASANIKAGNDKTIVVSDELKDLPADYRDVAAIRKYSSGSEEDTIAAMKRQMEELRSQHDALEQELMGLRKRGPDHPSEDPQTQQAKSSSLIFSGLGGGADSMIGGGGQSSGSMGPGSVSGFGGQSQASAAGAVAPSQQQATLFAKQAEDTQKLAVMKAADNPEDIYDLHNVVKPVSPYEIQAGTVIPAVLITGIDSSLSGAVVAQVRQSVFDSVTGKFMLVPKGSKLLGEYESKIAYGQRRVMLFFTRIIRPDGTSVLLGKPNAADLQGRSGVEGDVDNHWARILGAATISTILSIGAGVASDNTGSSGNANYQSSRQNAILGGAQGIQQVGQAITNSALSMQPTITLQAGFQFNVIVKKDMVMTPYQPK